ncbi:PRK06761 family protein [Paenibacillus lautus]
MKTKLIMVEGLPGFGKSTTSRMLHDILSEHNIEARLVMEGDTDHPADYEGTACLTEEEFGQLLEVAGPFKEIWIERAVQKGSWNLLPYQKLKNEYGASFPDDLYHSLAKKDIYELPLDLNRWLITDRWGAFAEQALHEPTVTIFECCFIQNPVTVGMVKHDAPEDQVTDYVLGLEKAVLPLNPLLFYIEQNDLEYAFRKAIRERPEAWSTGFAHYYTGQGYGKHHGLEGVEGTLQVLEARRELEHRILDKLELNKELINNSLYDQETYRTMLMDKLKRHGIIP